MGFSAEMSREVVKTTFGSRARTVFTVFGGFYIALLVLLTIPWIQTHALFMNVIKLPLFVQYDNPESYGMAPGKVANIKIVTPDNHTLGAWFILSDNVYQSMPFPPPPDAAENAVHEALASQPTILFLHGNTATRAFYVRVRQYSGFSSRVRANVLAIDYRGFGDSEGTPSESGLTIDSRAAWDWLTTNGAKPEDIVIVGHSLGTAVASKLAVSLAEDGTHFKGLALLSPFSSLHAVVDTYCVFGFLPVMLPLTMVPGAADLFKSFLRHEFNTLSIISRVKVPLLILHSENDWDIPHWHSDALFDALLEPYLTPVASLPHNVTLWSTEEWSDYEGQLTLRSRERESLVTRTHIHNFGDMHEFESSEKKIVLVKALTGWHEPGTIEGVQDTIRHVFSFA
ncbi:Alpha/Beta hydrolase protein [Pisolithus croceorrhizus]|nr:Alpha/Beta hydrolase protein [Pisolithus croceorrhizus]